MLKDLRGVANITGVMTACYLAEDSARITSPTFKVWIPSVMGGINKELTEYEEELNTDSILNVEKSEFPQVGHSQGYIVARSAHPYRIRHDGWIPKFKIEKLTAEDGTVATQSADSTDGASEPVGDHPSHPIKQALKLMGNKLVDIVFNKLIATNSTEIDYQELNNKYIKRGHLMYGCFIAGMQNTFVIFAIDNAVPYHAQKEYDSTNHDNPDTSFDNGEHNAPN